jgi:hypothetical protein
MCVIQSTFTENFHIGGLVLWWKDGMDQMIQNSDLFLEMSSVNMTITER